MIVVLIILFFSIGNLTAQEFTEPEDSTWNLFEYDQDSLTYESDYQIDYSLGWFPTPVKDYNNLSFYFTGGWLIDLARGINSASWIKTANPYTRTNPFEEDEGNFKKTFSNDQLDYAPSRYLVNLGFDYRYAMSFPLILKFYGDVMFTKGILYSADYQKYFTSWSGERKQIKEVGVLTLYEVAARGGIGFEIPIYGAYMQMDKEYFSNTYYFSAGVSMSYPFYQEGTQYLQIATNKDHIRYNNGRDTLRLISEQKLATLTPYRYYLDLGLGLEFEGSGDGAAFEIYCGLPLNSVLNDAYWGQILFGIKISIRLKNLFN